MARRMDVLETMPVSPWSGALRWLLRLWAAFVIAFLYLPIALLVLFSFQHGKNVGFPFLGPSIEWYEQAVDNPQLLSAVANSIWVAVAVAALATVIGTMAAFGLVRGGVLFPNGIRIAVTMPIMLPGILLGISVLIFLARCWRSRPRCGRSSWGTLSSRRHSSC